MSETSVGAAIHTGGEAPGMLSRSPVAAPTLPPVRQSPDLAAMHHSWSRVHAAGTIDATETRGIRRRVQATATALTGVAQREDRALIGDVIRATDALAGRCDELAVRTSQLEALVEEIVCVVSEDLTYLRSLLSNIHLAEPPVDGSGSEASSQETSPEPSTGMGDPPESRRVAVLSQLWGDSGDEVAFVSRKVAGALSRIGAVDVLAPGMPGPPHADGAFDVHGVGSRQGSPGRWPDPRDAMWPDLPPPSLAVVDPDDPSSRVLLEHAAPGVPVLDTEAIVRHAGMHVAVNPLAATSRHNGLGFTGYVLVLTDRERGTRTLPPPAAAWLTARFPRRHIVVVEDGTAAAWRARALRGVIAVDSRTDLWRLMAHARVVVDLDPGSLVARECIEAMRFGTPVVAPTGAVARDLAGDRAGLWFRGVAELLACVEALDDPDLHDAVSARGRAEADDRFGDPARFVTRVTHVIEQIVGT